MPKADSYRAPGHDGVVALFFKQPTEKLHADRKRVWQRLFTKEGYVFRAVWVVPSLNSASRSLAKIAPFLEQRTFELIECLERRQAASPAKGVDLEECLFHWSYDFMVLPD